MTIALMLFVVAVVAWVALVAAAMLLDGYPERKD